jgi:hypothetical protein
MVKFTVRMSTGVRDYPADVFLSMDRFLTFYRSALTVKTRSHRPGSAWIRVHGFRGGGSVRVSGIKEGALPLFLTSNQSQLNNWGFKRCVHTLFFPNRIAGFLVESPLQTGEGGFFVLQVFHKLLVLKMSDQGVFLGDPKGKLEIIY